MVNIFYAVVYLRVTLRSLKVVVSEIILCAIKVIFCDVVYT